MVEPRRAFRVITTPRARYTGSRTLKNRQGGSMLQNRQEEACGGAAQSLPSHRCRVTKDPGHGKNTRCDSIRDNDFIAYPFFLN